MAVLVDENTKAICQGLTGSQGRFRVGKLRIHIIALSLFGLAGCMDVAEPPAPVAEQAVSRDTVPLDGKVSGYLSLFGKACIDTASKEFAGAADIIEASGLHRKGKKFSDGTAQAAVDVFSYSGRTVGQCSVTVPVPQDDALIAGLQRLVNSRGLASGPPKNSMLGTGYALKGSNTLITLGRRSNAGPTTMRVNIGVSIN